MLPDAKEFFTECKDSLKWDAAAFVEKYVRQSDAPAIQSIRAWEHLEEVRFTQDERLIYRQARYKGKRCCRSNF